MTDAEKVATLADIHDLRLACDCAEARLFDGRNMHDRELREQFATIRRLARRLPGRESGEE